MAEVGHCRINVLPCHNQGVFDLRLDAANWVHQAPNLLYLSPPRTQSAIDTLSCRFAVTITNAAVLIYWSPKLACAGVSFVLDRPLPPPDVKNKCNGTTVNNKNIANVSSSKEYAILGQSSQYNIPPQSRAAETIISTVLSKAGVIGG